MATVINPGFGAPLGFVVAGRVATDAEGEKCAPRRKSWRPVLQTHAARRRIPGKGLDDLLRGPLARRIFRDIAMHDTAAIVPQDEEDEQHLEGGCGQREEVDGHQIGYVMVEKAPPRLGGWGSVSHHVLGHGGLGNRDAELHQLATHAGSAPERIGRTDVPDQFAYVGSDTWSSGPTPPALAGPLLLLC